MLRPGKAKQRFHDLRISSGGFSKESVGLGNPAGGTYSISMDAYAAGRLTDMGWNGQHHKKAPNLASSGLLLYPGPGSNRHSVKEHDFESCASTSSAT